MTFVLLLIIIALLFYLIRGQKSEAKEKKKNTSYTDILPSLLHKECEIVLNSPAAHIDIMYSAKGLLVDYDDDWIMLETTVKKKSVIKIVRIRSIESIKGIL